MKEMHRDMSRYIPIERERLKSKIKERCKVRGANLNCNGKVIACTCFCLFEVIADIHALGMCVCVCMQSEQLIGVEYGRFEGDCLRMCSVELCAKWSVKLKAFYIGEQLTNLALFKRGRKKESTNLVKIFHAWDQNGQL